jgi:mRNA degradation ribonuclease J1/J2
LSATRKLVNETVERNQSNGNLQGDLEQTLKSFLYNKTRRRPMVFITLSRA